MSQIFIVPVIFLIGLAVGSFLNCVIYRLGQPKSAFRGRSFCPNCKHILGFSDLIPLLSFILLKGRCRYCQKKISWQYPLVELATGLIFVLIFNFYFSIEWVDMYSVDLIYLIYLLVVVCLLEIIFVYDLKHYIIPDKVLLPAIFLVAFFRGVELFFNELQKRDLGISAVGLGWSWIAGLAASGFFFLIWLVSRGKWMGFGDVKLAFFMGLFLGMPGILVGLFSAFFIGGIIGLGLILLGKKKLKSEIPFGPFLIAGTFIALFWGQSLVNWYLGLM